MPRTRPIAACALSIAMACALEVPSGVVAVLNPGNSDETGGSAVVIDSQGHALTLAEALPTAPGPVTVVLPGGLRRTASVISRPAATTAVLLLINDLPGSVRPIPLADSRRLQICDPVWSVGNACGSIEHDGVPVLSHGVISGIYDLGEEPSPPRGRNGRILSSYRGPALETDAAINDGNQGGALLDDAGRLIALTSQAQARERRLPVAVPLARILDALDLPPVSTAPAGGGEAWRSAIQRTAPSVALIYCERTQGPGNPIGVPRPPKLPEAVPEADRERLRSWWDNYRHQQQIFFTDQPVTALAVGPDLLLTAASNLHGGAERARLLGSAGPIACTVIGRDLPLDLALLRSATPHGLPTAPFADALPGIGSPVSLLGRHRLDAPWTATAGSISAIDRRRAQSRLAFIQTDARANYGSLGGPLIDAQGQVIALCVLLGPHDSHPWLINSGVAMAIDAGRIREALPAMIAGRTTEKPVIHGLGVHLRMRSDRLVVERVSPGSGAADAGLQAEDVLLGVEGVRATSHDAIARVMLRHKPGDIVPVDLKRGDSELQLNVQIRELSP